MTGTTNQNHPRSKTMIWSRSLVYARPSLPYCRYPSDHHESRLSSVSTLSRRSRWVSCDTSRERYSHCREWQYRPQFGGNRLVMREYSSMGGWVRCSVCEVTRIRQRHSRVEESPRFQILVRYISSCTSELWSSPPDFSSHGCEFSSRYRRVLYSWYCYGELVYAECCVGVDCIISDHSGSLGSIPSIYCFVISIFVIL